MVTCCVGDHLSFTHALDRVHRQEKAQNCDGHHSFALNRGGTTRQVGSMAPSAPEGDCHDQDSHRTVRRRRLAPRRHSDRSLASVSKPTAEERGACMGDAISLCITAIPNKARIASCLASKMSQLSPRCRAQFDKAAGR
jgi:hypothetical protein